MTARSSTPTALRDSLEAFAANWLKVISSRTSIALNRVAVSHAASGKSNLGRIVLANGRFAIGERLKPLLEAGGRPGCSPSTTRKRRSAASSGWSAATCRSGCCSATRSSFPPPAIARDAARAVDQFFTLYEADKNRPKIRSL